MCVMLKRTKLNSQFFGHVMYRISDHPKHLRWIIVSFGEQCLNAGIFGRHVDVKYFLCLRSVQSALAWVYAMFVHLCIPLDVNVHLLPDVMGSRRCEFVLQLRLTLMQIIVTFRICVANVAGVCRGEYILSMKSV